MRSTRLEMNRFLALPVLIIVSAVAALAQGSQGAGVVLFNGRDGKGMSQAIPAGVYQVDGKQLGSNDVSVTVSKDFFVRFCAEKNGGGTCEEFGEGTHNLASAGFNFIKVWKGQLAAASVAPVIIYEELNWLGRSQVFRPGMYRSFKGEFGMITNDHAMSIVVAKGYRARLCVDEGINYRGAGDCEIHEEGRHNLRFGNAISFIEVKDLSDTSPDDDKLPVVLYEDPSQVGKMQGFDVGAYSASKGEFKKMPNDQASSIVVKDGYRASVCSDEPAGSEPAACEEFGPGKKNLKSKKTASYLKVWKDSK